MCSSVALASQIRIPGLDEALSFLLVQQLDSTINQKSKSKGKLTRIYNQYAKYTVVYRSLVNGLKTKRRVC